MGQKVHPTGFRLGISTEYSSNGMLAVKTILTIFLKIIEFVNI